MPSGFTAKLAASDQSFADFARGCARGMMALVNHRDEPLDAPLPERIEPDTSHHENYLAEAEDRLAFLRGLTPAQAAAEATKEHRELLAAFDAYAAQQAAQAARYTEMLAQARAYVPPTPDHEGFRAFMVSQLEESLRFDCGGGMDVPALKTGRAWLEEALERAEHERTYHRTELRLEIERAKQRNAWLQALKASLGGVA